MDKHITTPITEKITADLHSGDYVYITGEIYVARDAAHKRMIEALDRGEDLPINIEDATIYYMGPSPAREGRPIDLRDQQQLPVWINMRRDYSIWVKKR